MGLTSWKNAPAGPVRKTDVAIAKNYLSQDEIAALNQIVSAYLEFAELQAKGRRPMYMADWIGKLDDFLNLSERDVLTHAGRISHKSAEEHARVEFMRFDEERRRIEALEPTSDFDRAVEDIQKLDRDTRHTQGRSPSEKPPKKGKKRNES